MVALMSLWILANNRANFSSTSTSLFLLLPLLLYARAASSSSSSSSSAAAAASPLSNGPWGPTNPVAHPDATVIYPGPNNTIIRITILTARLLRIERAATLTSHGDQDNNDAFENRKTIAVINRQLPVPAFHHHVQKDDKTVVVETNCLRLSYQVGRDFSPETLQIQGSMYCDDNNVTNSNTNHNDRNENNSSNGNNTRQWIYRYGQSDPGNLLGTIRTLDRKNAVSLNCTILAAASSGDDENHCEWGLVSQSGFAIVNDTLNYALTSRDDWWDGPNRDLEDFYIYGHGHDYAAALYEYRLIGGAIPLLPRYALGVWFSRWYAYTSTEIAELVHDYEQHTIPLDVFVLDMNWHTKNDWTGYSWDRRLFPQPQDEIAYLKHRGVAVTMNLHDANGVNVWEERYQDICVAIGGCSNNNNNNNNIPFSIVNETIVYALEDTVLKPLEDVGVDFWWIDWQQGETGKGGAAGGKQNPTIWTAHVRSTDANRRGPHHPEEEVKRTMVLARWGGLGAHRYPVHFSGDVARLTWDNLAYQPYFSMTATNVGAIWSHDIEGPSQDLELYTRWLQWGAVSGIMRSHDRGMSAGKCADNDPMTCSIVVPWQVAPNYAKANLEALRLRGSLIPYLYTAAFAAHQTGRWFTTPLYYKWPEMAGAYETASPRPDPKAIYDSQYLLGDDIWVAPVVKPANQSTGLAQMHFWVPPGIWVGFKGGQVLLGSTEGSSWVADADIGDVPMFARAGSIIPTIPVRPGGTVGLAMKAFEEIIWTVYLAQGAPLSGSGAVYEDDGRDTSYYTRDSYTVTTAIYNISLAGGDSFRTSVRRMAKTAPQEEEYSAGRTTRLIFTVSTSGHCEKLPTSRATTIRLVNALPPTRVVANGLDIPFSRFGGKSTWSYQSKDAAVVIHLPESKVSEGLQLVVDTSLEKVTEEKAPDGIGFQLQRAIAAKAVLDEIQLTPGTQTGQDKLPGDLLLAASAGSSLEYLAGNPSRLKFRQVLATYSTHLEDSLQSVRELKSDNVRTRNRIARAIALLESALQSS